MGTMKSQPEQEKGLDLKILEIGEECVIQRCL